MKNFEKEAIVSPGDYVIILDNTGRFGEQKADGEVDVTLEYELVN